MADQRPWWKLWVSALSDDDLQALSLEDWARWAMLGAHLKLHGEGGAMTCRRPGRALAKLWRTPRWDSVLATARRLPGVLVEVAEGSASNPDAVIIRMKNWKKYQEDTSRERMRALRERQRGSDGDHRHTRDAPDRHTTTPRSDGVEEKRGRGESPLPPASPPAPNGRPPIPPEAWNTDCPDVIRPNGSRAIWRHQQCVNAEYYAAHHELHARLLLKQCPHHRALQTSALPDDDVPFSRA